MAKGLLVGHCHGQVNSSITPRPYIHYSTLRARPYIHYITTYIHTCIHYIYTYKFIATKSNSKIRHTVAETKSSLLIQVAFALFLEVITGQTLSSVGTDFQISFEPKNLVCVEEVS